MKNAIFISYRREDTSHAAGRLHAELSRTFPKSDIFIDIDDLPPGVDFRKAIDEAVRKCDAVLVCIGAKWMGAGNGKRRLEMANDFVRLEIEAALDRDIAVVPVLVDGTPMPDENELPASIRPLAYRNASQLRHASFSADVRNLSQGLEHMLRAQAEAETAAKARKEVASAPPRHAPERAVQKPLSNGLIIAGLLIVAVTVGGAVTYWQKQNERAAEEARAVEVMKQKRAADKAAQNADMLAQAKRTKAEKLRLEALLKEVQTLSGALNLQHKSAMDSIRDIRVDPAPKLSSRPEADKLLRSSLDSIGSWGLSTFSTANGVGIKWEPTLYTKFFTNEMLKSIMTIVRRIERLDSMELPSGSRFTDLSSLKGLALRSLSLKGVAGITDLTPLKGMPLKELDITGATGITDLSPLNGTGVRITGASTALLATLR